MGEVAAKALADPRSPANAYWHVKCVCMRYRLRVVTDEPAARFELLHNIRKFGAITNTLAAAYGASGEIEAVAPAAASSVDQVAANDFEEQT
jgi:hypothetical protein